MDSLSNLEYLAGLRLRGGVDMRPTLLRVLTDLYVQKLTHTPEEERHYTELALRLLDAVDVPTRAAVAARLARHLSPPLQVVQRLAADLPDVAAPLCAPSQLPPPPRVSEPAGMAAPIAPAPASDVPEQESLPAEDAPGTIPADIASELNELFFAASAHERRLILLNLDVVAPLPAGRVALTHDAMAGYRLETAALARNREDFAGHLAVSLHIPRAQAWRIVSDDLGEPIVTAAKALKMPRDVLYRILLFVNTTVGHSVERVHALAALYDEMTVEAAEQMVAIWQAMQREEHTRPQHRPLHWNDEARARARSATATVRRAPAVHRSSERRDAS